MVWEVWTVYGGGINCVLLQSNVYFLGGKNGELDREPEEKN